MSMRVREVRLTLQGGRAREMDDVQDIVGE